MVGRRALRRELSHLRKSMFFMLGSLRGAKAPLFIFLPLSFPPKEGRAKVLINNSKRRLKWYTNGDEL